MHVRGAVGVAIRVGVLLTTAGLALGQSQTLVFTQDNDQPSTDRGSLATAPHVGVGQDAVVVAANRRLSLYSKAPSLFKRFDITATSPAYPFQIDPLTTSPWGDSIMLFDPQAGYDPVANRLWLLYLEGVGLSPDVPALGDIAKLHLGVSKDPADYGGGPLNTLADTHWWYYTHDTGTGTKAGPEYDLTDTNYKAYKNENGTHSSPDATVRLATMAFDEQAIMVTTNRDNTTVSMPFDPAANYLYQASVYTPHIFIIPRDHAAGSITDGDRPAESGITILKLDSSGSNRPADSSQYLRAVQEPYPNPAGTGLTNQVENAVFFISLGAESSPGVNTLRLRGIYDADPTAATDWTLQQHRDPLFPQFLMDIALPVASLEFAQTTWIFPPLPATRFEFPRTPDSTMPVNWRPHASGVWFHSAVLARDTEGFFRIFAVHAVHPIDDVSGQPTDQWVVQWYVIDPDLGNFHSSTLGAWQPAIAQPSHTQGAFSLGRISNGGDSYHPVIVVNRQGQAFIEYTYSDDTTWPEIRRVRLSNDYTAVVGPEVPVRAGPLNMAYDPLDLDNPGYWADYADAQADPFDNCRYWSTHTLVHDDTPPGPTNERDVWLFRQSYAPNCFQSNAMLDLNDDSEVDSYDMLEFMPMFDRRARRVDVDGNGVVDATDATLFHDAYLGYTGR